MTQLAKTIEADMSEFRRQIAALTEEQALALMARIEAGDEIIEIGALRHEGFRFVFPVRLKL